MFLPTTGVPENLPIFGGEEEERSASSRQATSLSEVSSDEGSPARLAVMDEAIKPHREMSSGHFEE